LKLWLSPVGSFALEMGEYGVSLVAPANGNVAGIVDEDLASALNEHVHGRPSALRLDLHQVVAPVAQLSLAKLLEIPYGEVRPHSWVARQIGRADAVDEVVSAVTTNPLPLLIPCHRVIRDDGHLGEFSLRDPARKKQLLEFEGLDVDRLEALAGRGVQFLADKTADTFHLPSCKLAPGLDEPETVEVRNAEEAHEARYEPCRRCRPV
jgi:O-6-methylguanine DNA methyltransferase